MNKLLRLLGTGVLSCSVILAGCYGTDKTASGKSATDVTLPDGVDSLTFPDGFLWGVATSAYQVEGAYDQDGKGTSNWDFLTNSINVAYGATGNEAIDQYNRYSEDVQLMAEAGIKSYRFSISWARIYPGGYPYEVDSSGEPVLDDDGKIIPVEPNAAGIQHYSDLIDELIAAGIEPIVTLYHWDMPLALWYGSTGIAAFNERSVVDAFVGFAKTCFEAYGDRVTRWVSLNEPYSGATMVEGIISRMVANSDMDANTVLKSFAMQDLVGGQITFIHHYLLAHAKTVALYHELEDEGVIAEGKIGMAFDISYAKAGSDSEADVEAAATYNDLRNNLYTYPFFKGKYPDGILEKLAEYGYSINETDEQIAEDLAFMQANPGDYVGMNYYSRSYVTAITDEDESTDSFEWDGSLVPRDQVIFNYIWLETHSDEPAAGNGVYDPQGMYDSLVYLDDTSGHLPILITENGASYQDSGDDVLADSGEVHDTYRQRYLKGHIQAAWLAIHDGVDLIGYTAWSLADNFEWTSGYGPRYGLIYIDYDNDLKRYPKDSYYWYQDVISSNGTDAK